VAQSEACGPETWCSSLYKQTNTNIMNSLHQTVLGPRTWERASLGGLTAHTVSTHGRRPARFIPPSPSRAREIILFGTGFMGLECTVST
jgi:hypothetical protein